MTAKELAKMNKEIKRVGRLAFKSPQEMLNNLKGYKGILDQWGDYLSQKAPKAYKKYKGKVKTYKDKLRKEQKTRGIGSWSGKKAMGKRVETGDPKMKKVGNAQELSQKNQDTILRDFKKAGFKGEIPFTSGFRDIKELEGILAGRLAPYAPLLQIF